MDNATSSILAAFRQKTGIVFSSDRFEQIEAAVRRAVSEAASNADMANGAALSNRLFDRLIDHLTVRETYFFRDYRQYEEISQRILPCWRDAHPQQGAMLRAWSAGCASGEEAYSLAMLLDQEAIPARTLGTDIAHPALRKAVRGVYDRWSLRGEGQRALAFCGAAEVPFAVPDRIRSRVEFHYLNLAEDSYPSPATGMAEFDLILCRNVLIYFDDAAVRSTASRLAASLAPGGWLVTGPSDPPLWEYVSLEPMITPAGVFYRRRAGVGLPDSRTARRQPASVQSQTRAARRSPLPAKPTPARVSPAKPSQAAPASDVSRVRELADRGELAQAIRVAEAALAKNPAAAELNHVRAITLLAAGLVAEAVDALRRIIYLDPSAAVAHFLMAVSLERLGDLSGAFRAFGRVDALCSASPPDEVIAYGDGETAARLAAIARANVVRLQMTGNRSDG